MAAVLRKKIRDMVAQGLTSAADTEVLAANFRRIRRSLGITQAKTAVLGKVNASYVGKIETGLVGFGTRAQQKWAIILGVERSEFLRRPDIATPVVGMVVEKGIVSRHPAGDKLEYMPSLRDCRADSEKAFCVRVATDALHPHLRKDSCLYVTMVPVGLVHNDDFIIYADQGEPESIKEIEWISEGKVLLRGIGRGKTFTKDPADLAMAQKIVFIGM
jgi:transcriptional regulator with XRE-family HTH domain